MKNRGRKFLDDDDGHDSEEDTHVPRQNEYYRVDTLKEHPRRSNEHPKDNNPTTIQRTITPEKEKRKISLCIFALKGCCYEALEKRDLNQDAVAALTSIRNWLHEMVLPPIVHNKAALRFVVVRGKPTDEAVSFRDSRYLDTPHLNLLDLQDIIESFITSGRNEIVAAAAKIATSLARKGWYSDATVGGVRHIEEAQCLSVSIMEGATVLALMDYSLASSRQYSTTTMKELFEVTRRLATDFLKRRNVIADHKKHVVEVFFEFVNLPHFPFVKCRKDLLDLLCEAIQHGFVNGETGQRWFHKIMAWACRSVAKYDTRTHALRLFKLALKVLGHAGDFATEVAATVQRMLVAADQLGHVMEFLPAHHLSRLAFVCRDVWNTTVCPHKPLYQRVRSYECNAKARARVPAFDIVNVLLHRLENCLLRKIRLEINFCLSNNAVPGVDYSAAMLSLLSESLQHSKKGVRSEFLYEFANMKSPLAVILQVEGIQKLLETNLRADQWQGPLQNTLNMFLTIIDRARAEDLPKERNALSNLQALAIAAIQRCPQSETIVALHRLDDLATPAEAAFFDGIKADPHAWTMAWSWRCSQEDGERPEEVPLPRDDTASKRAAESARRYFLRFALWLHKPPAAAAAATGTPAVPPPQLPQQASTPPPAAAATTGTAVLQPQPPRQAPPPYTSTRKSSDPPPPPYYSRT